MSSNIGKNIKILRSVFRMTIKDLASESKVGQSTISELETGKATNPKSDTISKIANVFNVPMDILFEDQMPHEFLKKPKSVLNAMTYERQAILTKRRENARGLRTIPESFINPEDARKYISMHQMFASDNFDVKNMSDENVLEFANDLLELGKMAGYKYRNK